MGTSLNYIKGVNPCGKVSDYKKPEDLWQKFEAYVEWSENNPVHLPTRVGLKGTATEIESRYEDKNTAPRPWLLEGFSIYAGISNWRVFKAAEKRNTPAWQHCIETIEKAILEQQITGAMVGLYSSSLTARVGGVQDPNSTQEIEIIL